jgi:hypothetical protein
MASSSSTPPTEDENKQSALPSTFLVRKNSRWGFFVRVFDKLKDTAAVSLEKTDDFYIEEPNNAPDVKTRRAHPSFLSSKVCGELTKNLSKMFETDVLLEEIKSAILCDQKLEESFDEYIELPVFYAVVIWYMTRFCNPYDGNGIGESLFGIRKTKFEQATLFKGADAILHDFFPTLKGDIKLTLHLFWLITTGSYFVFQPNKPYLTEPVFFSTKSTFFINFFTDFGWKSDKYQEQLKKQIGTQLTVFNQSSSYVAIDFNFFIDNVLDNLIPEYVSIWATTRDVIYPSD